MAPPEREEVVLGHLCRDAGELQVQNGQLRLVQVHGRDVLRLLEEVVEDVAARAQIVKTTSSDESFNSSRSTLGSSHEML